MIVNEHIQSIVDILKTKELPLSSTDTFSIA